MSRGANQIRQVLQMVLARVPPADVGRLARELLRARVQHMSADDALRLLFTLDADLYELQGRLASAYGDGLHAKHRLIGYHDFFVGRIAAHERVLDVGCGVGALAYSIATRAGAAVVGIDIVPRSIHTAQARHAHPNIQYVVGDALVAVPQGVFDVVVLSNVLEHLPERPAFLRRLCAATRPRRLLIRVPLFERDWRVPLKRELGVEWRLDTTHETEYTQESFAAELQMAHLVAIHQEIRWGEIWAEVTDAS